MSSDLIIGIDLGTTNSSVCVVRNGKVEMIPNSLGNNITPSYVAFAENDKRIVGEAAKLPKHKAQNVIFDMKRLIGRNYDDAEVQNKIRNWPFTVIKENSKPKVMITKKNKETLTFFPEAISAIILGELKKMAETYLNQKVEYCIITVPANFTNAQRLATINSANIAGLKVKNIINEPTAAAIAYGLKKQQNKNVLVYDLGGGTFDVSILKINGNNFKVLATGGNSNLGGEDFDNNVINYIVEDFNEKNNADIKSNKKSLMRLRTACEKAKTQLSKSDCEETEINIDVIYNCIDLNMILTREKFEELNADLFKSTIKVVADCLENAKLDKSEIDEIILVGGSTRIRKVRNVVSEYFNGKTLNHSINPDEAVARGAAIQASALSNFKEKGMQEVILNDITSNSMGIEIIFGRMSIVIPKNTPIPVKKTEVYFPTRHRQTTVDINVYEGEKELVADNTLLGDFSIRGFPPKNIGETKFDITFEIDENGLLTVTCAEQDSHIQDHIKIIYNKGQLTEDEINTLKDDDKEFRNNASEQQTVILGKENLLEYCKEIQYNMKKKIVKLSEADEQTVFKKCKEIFKWVQDNPSLTKEEYAMKLNETDTFCKHFIQ